MTNIVGTGYVEIRARSANLGADIRRAVDQAIPVGQTAAGERVTRNLRGELGSLTRQMSGFFGQSILSTTALQGFSAAEVSAAAGASSLAAPVVIVTGALLASAAGATAAVKAYQGYAGEVRGLQRITGQNAEEASGFAAVFNRVGVDVTTGGRALAYFTRNAAANREELARGGVQLAANADGTLNLRESYLRVAEAIAATNDPVEKQQLLVAAFGPRLGLALLPVLAQGRAGFEDLLDVAREAGLVLDEGAIAKSKELATSTAELSQQFKGLKVQVGEEVAPAFKTLADIGVPALRFVAREVDRIATGVFIAQQILNPRNWRTGWDELERRIDRFREGGADIKAGAADATAGLGELGEESEETEKRLRAVVDAEIAVASSTFSVRDATFGFGDAQRRVVETTARYNDLLHRSGEIADDLAASLREVRDATEEVDDAQTRVRATETRFGVQSVEAIDARRRLREATERQTKAEADRAKLLGETGPQGTKTADAARDLARARSDEEQAADRVARAHVDMREAVAAADGQTVDATGHARNYREELERVAATLAPGSDLRRNLLDTAATIAGTLPAGSFGTAAFGARDLRPPGAQGPTLGRPPSVFAPDYLNPPLVLSPEERERRLTIVNNFAQPVDVQQAAELNRQQAARVGGGSRSFPI